MSDPVVKIPTIKLTPVPGGVNVVQYGTLTIGSVETLEAGSAATVSNSGTIEKAVLDFGIPAGFDGKDGAAATVAIGTVTTGEPGTTASVTNVGTDTAAVLNITIPRGDKGTDGTGAGDVVAAADNTFTATNAFEGMLKTTCDMQFVSLIVNDSLILNHNSENIQKIEIVDASVVISFKDTDMPTGCNKIFLISIHKIGSGFFMIDDMPIIGGITGFTTIIDGPLPEIGPNEVLKIAMEVDADLKRVFVYVLGKAAF